MGPWLILLVCALVAFLIGAFSAAKWLFIIAIVLLAVRDGRFADHVNLRAAPAPCAIRRGL